MTCYNSPMTILEYIKRYGNLEHVVLLLDSSGYSDEQIIKLTGLSRMSIYNIRKRYEPLVKALEQLNEKE